jgi:transposase-like protein
MRRSRLPDREALVVSASSKTRSYRRWSPDERRAIAEESFDPLKTVTAVAKKHGVSAVSLYLWRKEFGGGGSSPDTPEPDDTGSAEALADRQAMAARSAETGIEAQGLPATSRRDDRVQDLERQLAQLQAELAASKRQRALLVSVLTSIGTQLKLLAEMEEATSAPAGDDAGGAPRAGS